MRDPGVKTPVVFDYLWLYWVMKHFFPKDIIYEIIGTHKKRTFYASGMHGFSFDIIFPKDRAGYYFSSGDIGYYWNWKRHPKDCS
jgi:hypothetical protein